MDLPSVQIALSHIDSSSDSDTSLSAPPEAFDKMDLDMEEDFDDMRPTSSLKRKAISRSVISDEDDLSDIEVHHPVFKRAKLKPHINSKFENVPTEILNQIVSHLSDDHDLFNLTCSCAAFAAALGPEDSAVWKERFLSRYDCPRVTESTQFAFAYQLRRSVLRQFVEFTNSQDPRLGVQLEVLRDMVIEAYNLLQTHLPPPLTSKNLAAFASPHNSPWIRVFLSCFFFPCRGQRYGQPHLLFDALQLVMSYLLLSPYSQMAHLVKASRANYDLAVVYIWDKPLAPLYYKLKTIEETPGPVKSVTSRTTRSTRQKQTPPKVAAPTHSLDTHALLHIRNFWHRHLLEQPRGFASAEIAENTYGKMMKDLMRVGITPKKWDKPLRDGDFPVATEWHGHYSTLAQWPKKRQELEEVQSLAEDWQNIDPLKLDFAISTNNDEDGFWSPIFRSIPAFQKTIPDLKSDSCIFIRGLAPFVDLSTLGDDRRTSPGSHATLSLPPAPKLPKYHPYLAMRLRGIIHSIPAQPQSTGPDGTDHSIPGWKRVVMVLYKPTKRHLIQVLEHAEEEFGDSFGSAITTQLMQNGTTNAQQVAQVLNGPAATGPPLDAAEIDAQLDRYLRGKLASSEVWRDESKLDKDAVEEMEERFRLSEYLDWNDMDYAYAYEGVLLPGGKIMMGRWWRLAMNGQSEGLEWSDALGEMQDGAADSMDGDGDIIIVDGIHTDAGAANGNGTGNGRARYKKLERGPFIFWS